MKKWNSVFTNLAVSYITIVIVIVLLLCSIFYVYFPMNYNEEIRNKNQIILENTANSIESSVFRRVEKIYLDLSLEKSGYTDLYTQDPLQANHSRVMDILDSLKDIVINNSDIVYAIHLFYVNQKAMISSAYGLEYWDEISNGIFMRLDWIDRMRSNGKSYLWIETHKVPEDIYISVNNNNSMNHLITYVHSYPFNSTGEKCELMIAIDIKEDAISKIIRNMMASDFKNTFIMNGNGRIISTADKGVLGNLAEGKSYIKRILSADTAAESFTDTIENNSYVVSYYKFASNRWSIFNITPTNNYYRKSIILQEIVLVICLMAIIIGFVLSGIFTITIYNPLKLLINRIRGLSDNSSETKTNVQNEYTLIDKVIDYLSDRVSDLEETLQAKRPVIKHNIVLNILKNNYGDEELDEQLQLLNISLEYSNFCCLMIDLFSTAFKELRLKNSQYVIYHLIHQLETTAFDESYIIAEELQDTKIAVIICTNRPDGGITEKLLDIIISEAKNSYDLGFKISCGSWVQKLMDVPKSFGEANLLFKYCYFYPEVSIHKDLTLLIREHSKDEIPQPILQEFSDKLYARNLNGIGAAIDKVLAQMREGMYSAEYCHLVLSKIVSMYIDYLKNVRYEGPDHVKMDLYKQYYEMNNINSFREWLINSITESFVNIEKRNDDRNIESVEAVKKYIDQHLSEELSLDTVASKVFISPKYLSKIFKEETGISYIDFVTKKRMERALDLMTKSNMTIEQITCKVGYGTAAYFIKKFKEIYGCTPKKYVRSLLEQE